MPAQLSKLHVRFIQTQKTFSLRMDDRTKTDGLKIGQLYIKDNSSFYFVNLGDGIQDDKTLTMTFKEANEYLSVLQCKVKTRIIAKGSEEYEDALLFFQVNDADVNALLLLSVIEISGQ